MDISMLRDSYNHHPHAMQLLIWLPKSNKTSLCDVDVGEDDDGNNYLSSFWTYICTICLIKFTLIIADSNWIKVAIARYIHTLPTSHNKFT